MVRGKNGRWVDLSWTVAAQSITVSPNCTRQEPCASFAIRPNSRLRVRPANWRSILWIISLFSLFSVERDHPVPLRFARRGLPDQVERTGS